MPHPIYLDHAATTPLDPRVLDLMLPFFGRHFGNPGSRLYQRGLDAEAAVTRARRQVAGLIGARPVEITFTGGATESNNLAMLGLVSGWTSSDLRPSDVRLIVSAIEHPSVLAPARELERRGAELHVLPVGSDGRVKTDVIEDLLGKSCKRRTLVSVMHANNETGTVQPIHEISRLCRRHGAVFHCDATQTVGKIEVDVRAMQVDLLSLSAHKCYGPMGVGALFIRRQRPALPVEALVYGGGQERAIRPGTLNLPGIVGLGAAAEFAGSELEAEGRRLAGLIDRLLDSLHHGPDGFAVHVNGSAEHRLPGTVNLSIEGVKASDLQQAVQPDLEISTGSACATGRVGPSHVIRALGLPRQIAEGALRIAIGRSTRGQDIDRASTLLTSAARRLSERGQRPQSTAKSPALSIR